MAGILEKSENLIYNNKRNKDLYDERENWRK